MRRLTRIEREALKRQISDARMKQSEGSRGKHGLAEVCFNAANGDPLLAIAYAVDALRAKRDWKPHVRRMIDLPREERRRSYEELFS